MDAKMQDAWVKAIPIARRIANVFAARRGSRIGADDIEQILLLEFPKVYAKIKNNAEYKRLLGSHFYNLAKKKAYDDTLGIGISISEMFARGGYPASEPIEYHQVNSMSDDDDDAECGHSVYRRKMCEQRVENHECFWCGELFYHPATGKSFGVRPVSLYCSGKCDCAARRARQPEVTQGIHRVLLRLRAGVAQVGELRSLSAKWCLCIEILKKLGYQFETNVTYRGCKNGYFRLIRRGVPLPACA